MVKSALESISNQSFLKLSCYQIYIKIQPIYQVLVCNIGCKLSKQELQQDFDLFYEDIFMELAKYGEIEEMHVCDNVGDHLVGNIYIRFDWLMVDINGKKTLVKPTTNSIQDFMEEDHYMQNYHQ
jgi:hypothetical protein